MPYSIALLLSILLPSLALAASASLSATPNTEPDLAKYRIYRAIPCGGQATFLVDVIPPSWPYVDNTVPSGVETVGYEVTAVDESGNESGRSNHACKTFTITYYKYVTDANGVTWGLVDVGLTPSPKYRVYRNGAFLGHDHDVASDLVLVDGVAYFGGTDGDTQWWVWTEANGWVPVPLPGSDTMAPAAPQNLTAD